MNNEYSSDGRLIMNNEYSDEVKEEMEKYVIDLLYKRQGKRRNQFRTDIESFINSVDVDIRHIEEGYDRGLISTETADELYENLRREKKYMKSFLLRFDSEILEVELSE